MKSKYFLAIVLLVSFVQTSHAEKHTLSPKLTKDFEIAVKNVENKNFLDAVKMFNELAENGLLREPQWWSLKASIKLRSFIIL